MTLEKKKLYLDPGHWMVARHLFTPLATYNLTFPRKTHYFLRFDASLVALNAKVMLAIPMLYYQTVLARSAVLWRKYRALKNGIINRDATVMRLWKPFAIPSV